MEALVTLALLGLASIGAWLAMRLERYRRAETWARIKDLRTWRNPGGI